MMTPAQQRQADADQRMFPRPFGYKAALRDALVWRGGVALPQSYVDALPTKPRDYRPPAAWEAA